MAELIYPTDSEPFADAETEKVHKLWVRLGIHVLTHIGMGRGEMVVKQFCLLLVSDFRLRHPDLCRQNRQNDQQYQYQDVKQILENVVLRLDGERKKVLSEPFQGVGSDAFLRHANVKNLSLKYILRVSDFENQIVILFFEIL